MLFQNLDNKKECIGVYLDGEIHKDIPYDKLTKTWRFSNRFHNTEVEFAQLYCEGKSLDEVCPEATRRQWDYISNKIKAFFTSFYEAKITPSDYCFYDLIPEPFLLEYCDVKNNITQAVLKGYPKPSNYDFMVELCSVLESISDYPLSVNHEALKAHLGSPKARSLWNWLQNNEPCIKYNPYGTVTGRLTTLKEGFPILTLHQDHRTVLTPSNDFFVELDFNAAELRTFVHLCGREQPQEDIHDWNAENIFRKGTTRDEAKKRIFAWLYNPNAIHKSAEAIYNRGEAIKKYYRDGFVHTPFGRKIPCDDKKCLNYLIQSTTSDLFLRRMIAVNKFLKENATSHIAFCIHDSLVIDLRKSEINLIPRIKEIFSSTDFGDFKTNVKAGRDFGSLKDLSWT